MNAPDEKLTLTQRKRLDILAAARTEFLETGFRDTSMDRVAERAQVSKRTVYNHFPSKEALFSAIASQFIAEAQEAMILLYEPELPLDRQLREIARKKIAVVTAEDHVAMLRVFLAELRDFPNMFNEVMADSSKELDPIAAWIQAAADDGRLKVDSPQLASNQFVSLLKGALFWPRVAGYGEPVSKSEQAAVIDAAVAMFLDHYQAQ